MILRGGWAAVGWGGRCGELELSDRFGGRAFGNLHHIVLLLLLHPSYFDLRPSFFDFSLHARLRLLARWKRLGNVGSLGWRGATLVFLRTSTDNISFFDISIMDRVDACVSISSEYGCVTSCGIGWVDGWCP